MVGYIVLVLLNGGVVVLFGLMVFIIFGIGLFKLNVFNVVGDLYLVGDNCCDVGFSIFYMGINLGVFIVLFIVLVVFDNVGSFYVGFGVVVVGMVIVFVVYVFIGKCYLKDVGKKVLNLF